MCRSAGSLHCPAGLQQHAEDTERLPLQDIVASIQCKQPGYRPPPDIRANKRTRKILVPVREHPGCDFVGLILGPRGRTQQRMQAETGASIVLRGNSAVKEGKVAGAGLAEADDTEDLHVLLSADTEDALNRVGCPTAWLVRMVATVMPDA